MVVLVVTVNGERCKQCDARCYDAKHGEDCGCACAGINHGVGEIKAANNTQDYFEQMTNYCKQTFGAGAEVLRKVHARQLELFKL